MYFVKKEEVIADIPFSNIEEHVLDAYDAAFSFVWGADGVAGACSVPTWKNPAEFPMLIT